MRHNAGMNEPLSDSSDVPGAAAAHPFTRLTPECVLDAIDSVLAPTGVRTDGRLLPLNSYENRVYQVGVEDGPPVVAKFYRPQRWSDEAIAEEHAFDGFRFAIFERRGGRAPDLDRRDTLEWMGRFIGRIHALGKQKPYTARPTLDIATFGCESRDFLLSHDFLPAELRASYEAAAALALEGVERAFEAAGEIAFLRLHGDCHASNVLWTDAGPHFVDFDDSRMGPAVQDLWLLLPGGRSEASSALSDLLAGYEDFCEFEPRELHLIEALRTLRLLHYAAWLARRWDDPAFPAAFPWFNTQRYWEARVLELREQIGAMQEGPLWPV